MKKEWTWETIVDTLIAEFKRDTYIDNCKSQSNMNG